MCKIVSKIPIFITVRGNTEENIKKNKNALKFSYLYIKEQNLFPQTYIISDNKELIEYSKKLGFKNQIHYPCGNEKDIKYLEYLATYRYGIENNYHPDWIILLNVKQLFKSNNLLVNCISNIDNNYDVITSYTYISDRSKFFINEETNNLSYYSHLLSSEENRMKMLDASIYGIKTDFAFECMKYDDPSEHFWSGKMKFFENNDLYTDIYLNSDISKLESIKNYLNEYKKIKEPV